MAPCHTHRAPPRQVIDPLGDLPQAGHAVDRQAVQTREELMIAIDEEDGHVLLEARVGHRFEERRAPSVGCEAEIAKLEHHPDATASGQPNHVGGAAGVGVPVSGEQHRRGLGQQQQVSPHLPRLVHRNRGEQTVFRPDAHLLA